MNNNTKALLRILKDSCGGIASKNKLMHLSGFTVGVVTRCIEQMINSKAVRKTCGANSKKTMMYIELINNNK